MQFRDARREDLEALVKLLADDELGRMRENLETPLPRAYLNAFEELTAQIGNRLIVAVEEDETIIGCLQLTLTVGIARQGMKRATIEGVRVTRNARGSGIGKQLFEHAIEEARLSGCGMVQLTTDKSRPDAHRFYERLGFEPSHVGMKLVLR